MALILLWLSFALPPDSLGDRLRAPHLILAEVLIQTPHTLTVRTVTNFGAATPGQLKVTVTAPPLTVGTLLLLPLKFHKQRWWAVWSRPMAVEARLKRVTVRFVETWRQSKGGWSLERWLAVLSHPAAVAQALSQVYLKRIPQASIRQWTPAQWDQFFEPALVPGSLKLSRARVRATGLLGSSGSDALARRFDRLSSNRLRLSAVGIFSRFPTATARSVVSICAREYSGSLGTRCRRLVTRFAQRP